MNNYFMPLRQTICIYTLSFLSFGKIVQNQPKGQVIYLANRKCLSMIQIWPCFIIETRFWVWEGCTNTHFSDIKIIWVRKCSSYVVMTGDLQSNSTSASIEVFEKWLHILTQWNGFEFLQTFRNLQDFFLFT